MAAYWVRGVVQGKPVARLCFGWQSAVAAQVRLATEGATGISCRRMAAEVR